MMGATTELLLEKGDSEEAGFKAKMLASKTWKGNKNRNASKALGSDEEGLDSEEE